eukprot:g25286.t1
MQKNNWSKSPLRHHCVGFLAKEPISRSTLFKSIRTKFTVTLFCQCKRRAEEARIGDMEQFIVAEDSFRHDFYFQAVSEKATVSHKPHVLHLDVEMASGVRQRFSFPIKISQDKIKRRSNTTEELALAWLDASSQECIVKKAPPEHRSLCLQLSPDVNLPRAVKKGFLIYVETKGGKTEGRQQQRYLLLRRDAVYLFRASQPFRIISLKLISQKGQMYELNFWPEDDASNAAIAFAQANDVDSRMRGVSSSPNGNISPTKSGYDYGASDAHPGSGNATPERSRSPSNDSGEETQDLPISHYDSHSSSRRSSVLHPDLSVFATLSPSSQGTPRGKRKAPSSPEMNNAASSAPVTRTHSPDTGSKIRDLYLPDSNYALSNASHVEKTSHKTDEKEANLMASALTLLSLKFPVESTSPISRERKPAATGPMKRPSSTTELYHLYKDENATTKAPLYQSRSPPARMSFLSSSSSSPSLVSMANFHSSVRSHKSAEVSPELKPVDPFPQTKVARFGPIRSRTYPQPIPPDASLVDTLDSTTSSTFTSSRAKSSLSPSLRSFPVHSF